MKAVVVYESLWGNTAAVARAIAEGIGPDARALSTAEGTPETMSDADLVVAGAPILGFNLPTESMRSSIGKDPRHAAQSPPDLSHPSMRAWLGSLPAGHGLGAAFETRIWWSPGSSARRIDASLTRAGYSRATAPQRFIVTGAYGPLKDGEIERARSWGRDLAAAVTPEASTA
ncbi:MAG: flavodoxin [Actinomycetota bacterium]|nr:flavodoxin [Actinomycetota bacterium]